MHIPTKIYPRKLQAKQLKGDTLQEKQVNTILY